MAKISFDPGNSEAHSIKERVFQGYVDRAEDRDSIGIGASMAGKPCDRQIWYSLRWATREEFDGRMRRLFDRGNIEEARVISDLRLVGYTIRDLDPATNEQFRANGLGGWLRGKTDGEISGPDLPKGVGLLEIKTHNDNSFKKLRQAAGGVRFAKPEHYLQMQLYMHARGMRWGLYVAVNKNDEDWFPEVVDYDIETVERAVERLKRIIPMEEAPERAGASEDSFTCKFCPHKPVCWKKADARRTCRSCIHSTFWQDPDLLSCEQGCGDLRYLVPEQAAGCGAHILRPDMSAHLLLDGEVDPVTGKGKLRYERKDGTMFDVEVPGR